MPVSHRLLAAPAAPPGAVHLDEAQRQVVAHRAGPLLVLAGPGTGKTTTLVEAIAARIDDGVAPDAILALTFSRKAAEQLRDRVTARVGRTVSAAMSATFHSFAYGLIRHYAPTDLYDAPLRLLSAPEQDVVLRELLADHPESVHWPASLGRALGTRGFAHEVGSVLARAREKGLDGAALTRLGAQHDLPEFVAAGAFLDQYLTVLDSQGATDYADLIRRAALEAEHHVDELRARFSHVFVDEYQDTDPGQVALLRAIAGDGRNLTVVGDPHQSIYGFRGAEVRGILDFPTEFPTADGRPAPVVALRTTRRFGPRLLRASQRVATRLSLPGSIPIEARKAFSEPEAEAAEPGRLEVFTFDTDRAEAEHLADLLRRAHLSDGIAWDQMAVLVRSGRTTIPGLRRSLTAAGVPVEVAADDLPLVRDPATQPLLEALRAVVHLGAEQGEDGPDPHSLLMGPLGGMDAGEVRRLARQLRSRAKARASETGEPVPTSDDLVRQVLVDPARLDGLDGPEAARAHAFVTLLDRARTAFEAGATAEQLLWLLWDGTDWPARLRRSVEAGGGAARRAHRDLDAICALFDAAARAETRRDHTGVVNFLATLVAQQIPGDSLAERGVRGSSVRLLTAHRAKGLQWRLVVVAHVQAEGWPDLRRRSTLLPGDLIGTDGLQPPVTARELLLEERRLFYVACTRATERLVVTAVASADDDGEQPSRFLGELGVQPEHLVGRPRRPMSMAGLVAELRRTVADPDVAEGLRLAAARRLAALAREQVGGRPLVPAADPSTWWGTRAASRAVQPLRDPEAPVPVSATMVDAITTCAARWFFEREAGGASATHQAANLGNIVHAVAERVGRGELEPRLTEELLAEVDRVWSRMSFRIPWARERERERVQAAMQRFFDWHTANPRALAEVEKSFSAVVELEDGRSVRLTGKADRLEVDSDGRVVVVDLKTGRTKASKVDRHVQLAFYQYAVDAGAFADARAPSGGAELVQLGLMESPGAALVQRQEPHADAHPVRAELRSLMAAATDVIRDERFPATPGGHCTNCGFHTLCPTTTTDSVVEA
ncbi:ATP-dependent helicase [Nocardioides limicola]|uniref:ATP-dependent helicase n=1 Tax=Nocardioides limicola TaxID=2803368 RepID=UPI00193C1674|nr:ATP-dependent DNA helicase [Nocardioides sp. DJM-14]